MASSICSRGVRWESMTTLPFRNIGDELDRLRARGDARADGGRRRHRQRSARATRSTFSSSRRHWSESIHGDPGARRPARRGERRPTARAAAAADDQRRGGRDPRADARLRREPVPASPLDAHVLDRRTRGTRTATVEPTPPTTPYSLTSASRSILRRASTQTIARRVPTAGHRFVRLDSRARVHRKPVSDAAGIDRA